MGIYDFGPEVKKKKKIKILIFCMNILQLVMFFFFFGRFDKLGSVVD